MFVSSNSTFLLISKSHGTDKCTKITNYLTLYGPFSTNNQITLIERRPFHLFKSDLLKRQSRTVAPGISCKKIRTNWKAMRQIQMQTTISFNLILSLVFVRNRDVCLVMKAKKTENALIWLFLISKIVLFFFGENTEFLSASLQTLQQIKHQATLQLNQAKIVYRMQHLLKMRNFTGLDGKKVDLTEFDIGWHSVCESSEQLLKDVKLSLSITITLINDSYKLETVSHVNHFIHISYIDRMVFNDDDFDSIHTYAEKKTISRDVGIDLLLTFEEIRMRGCDNYCHYTSILSQCERLSENK